MRWTNWTILCLALFCALVEASPRVRRQTQLASDNELDPSQNEADSDGAVREKRKLEGFTQAKFGVKNAVLGLVFGKINSILDAKTRLIDTLDKQNIVKNKAYGIEAPANGLSSLGGIFSQVIGPKLQIIGPKLNLLTGVLGGASGGGAGGAGGSSGGGGLGSILSIFTSLSGSSSGGGGGATDTIDSSSEEDDD